MLKRFALLLSLVAGLLLLAACGGGGEKAATPTATATTVRATATATTTSAAPTATATTAATASTGGTALSVGSVGELLQFDKTTLSATAGATVTVSFKNNSGSVQHNWVLVRNGTKDEVGIAGISAGAQNDFVPTGDSRVLANSKLANPGQTVQVTFTAPAAGTYQFLCTFPGHYLSMYGTFEVTS